MNGQMIRLELKYCEQCGGLLLRRAGDSAVVFCAPCGRRAEQLPVARKRTPGNAEVNGIQSGRLA
jgi:uncharacterized Zn finger protein (UPF0148 family)